MDEHDGAQRRPRGTRRRTDCRHLGDVVVHGSATLVHALLDKGLVDELRLIVFPAILGHGPKLFAQTSAALTPCCQDVSARRPWR